MFRIYCLRNTLEPSCSSAHEARRRHGPTFRRRAPARPRWCDQDSHTGRKISSILIRNTVCPSPFARLWGSCWRLKRQITATRSCYEYHPAGRPKTVRTTVGRSISRRTDRVAPRNQRPERESQRSPSSTQSKRKQAAGSRARPKATCDPQPLV